jgi:hypothetical protein
MARGQEEQLKQMRPTLLIGLGGTGQKVLVQLKARFIRNYGAVPRPVEFLAFDTDQGVEETAIMGERVRLTPGTELHNIGNVETAEIVQHLSRYPAMAAWMSEDKERFPIRAVTMGAQQVRPLGRLAFFWHVGDIYVQLLSAVSRLTHLELEAEKRGMNVFIVTSVCGGTGSGIFLDMAYLVRHVVNQSNIRDSSCYINGILALPSVFPTVDPQGIESNAFAALAELDYLMDSPSWSVDYGNPRVSGINFQARRPFNICYLIDARNENGQGLQGLEEIAPMIAEAVYLQVSSQVGDANNSAFDNVHILGQNTVNVDTEETRPTAYSSLGTAAINFPAEKIIEYCAHKLGVEIISGDLLRPTTDEAAVKKVIDEFIQTHQVDTETMLENLARDADNKVRGVAIVPGQLDSVDLKELPRAVNVTVSRASTGLDNELLPMLDRNQAAVRSRLERSLATEVERLVQDQNYGLTFADVFLAQLDARLAEMREKLGKEKEEIDTRRGQAEARQKNFNKEFQDSFAGGLPFGRKKKVYEARDRYLAQVQTALRGRFDVRRREVAVSALSAFSTAVSEQRRRVQTMIDRLRRIEQQFRSTVDRIASEDRSNVLAQEITSKADIEKYYQDYKGRGSVRPVAGLGDEYGPFGRWLDMDQESMANNMLAFTRRLFLPVSDISVETVILEKDKDQNRKRLIDLITRSVPFWSYRKAGVLPTDWKPQEIVVVGVDEKEQSIYKNAVSREQQLTSTFDKHQLLVLQTKHGLPLFALTQFGQYRNAHDVVMQRNLKPLYVLPEVRPGGHKAKQYFALGIIFGEIFVSGAFYYLKPENKDDPKTENKIDPPIKLGQGMTNALQVLRGNESLIRSLETRINARVADIGKAPASEMVETWVAAPTIDERRGGVTKVDQEMIKNNTIGGPTYVAADLVADLRTLMKNYNREVLKG